MRRITRFSLTAAAAAGLYAGALMTANHLSFKGHLKLSPAEMSSALEAECRELRIRPDITIELKLYPQNRLVAGTRKVEANRYLIQLAPDRQHLGALRHELYHIAAGHAEKTYTDPAATDAQIALRNIGLVISYLFHDEPAAIAYTLSHR